MNIEIEEIFDEIMGITKSTYELLISSGSHTLSLYMFYYYTAKWQKTNIVKATTDFAIKGSKLSEAKFREAKKFLIDNKLIEDIQRKNPENNKIEGHYIKVNYIFSKKTLENFPVHTPTFPEGGNRQRVEKSNTNALSNININALSNNNKIIEIFSQDKFYENLILEFVDYRKKIGKKMTEKALEILLKKFFEWMERFSKEEIKGFFDKSIMNGRHGVFEDKKIGKAEIQNRTDSYSEFLSTLDPIFQQIGKKRLEDYRNNNNGNNLEIGRFKSWINDFQKNPEKYFDSIYFKMFKNSNK